MVQRIVLYTTQKEKNTAIAFARTLGETQIHDDHRVGPSGENQLIFDKIIDIIIPPDPNDIRLDVLENKAKNDLPMTTSELREMYKLKHLT